MVVSPLATTLGAVDVTVTTPGGTSATSPADLFFYSAPGAVAPRVSAISPQFGSPGGGTLVTITGSGYSPGGSATVFFGQTAATNVTIISPTTITAQSPAGTGAVNVTVDHLRRPVEHLTRGCVHLHCERPAGNERAALWVPRSADVAGH